MKIIVAYDGSECADAALDDIGRAGLPNTGDALVMSIAELWMPPPESSEEFSDSPHLQRIAKAHEENRKAILLETGKIAESAAKRLQSVLPGWTVLSKAGYGSPAWELVSEATEFGAELIVIGSHGRSALGRFVLGSISQKVVTESRISVRVARGKVDVDLSPVRIVVGFDRSNGARAAVDAVAARNWPEGSEVKLLAVSEPVSTSFFGGIVPIISTAVEDINNAERELLAELGSEAAAKLSAAGLTASFEQVTGNPKREIVAFAESWSADSIFVGAHAYTKLERFLLGSVSAAVAARSNCSVEVVRIIAGA